MLIQRAELTGNDEVRFGLYATSVAALMQRIFGDPARARIERNPETGEIIKPASGR